MQSTLIKTGNLLEYEGTIAHQANCISTSAAGIAADLFRLHPYANVYAERKTPSVPGTIEIRTKAPHRTIAIYGQVYPGRPKYPESNTDGYRARQRYFHLGLKAIAAIPDLKEIAFPYGIGCGLAGGDLIWYTNILHKFAAHLADRVTVSIIKLPPKVPDEHQ